MTFSQLKQKEVINTCDGGRLGSVCDAELSPDGRILALIVPGPFTFSAMFRPEGLSIPWQCVNLMGEDVILVTLPEVRQDGRRKPRCSGGKHDA